MFALSIINNSTDENSLFTLGLAHSSNFRLAVSFPVQGELYKNIRIDKIMQGNLLVYSILY
jgi:hypothetical protein